jgi:hypothetical protein
VRGAVVWVVFTPPVVAAEAGVGTDTAAVTGSVPDEQGTGTDTATVPGHYVVPEAGSGQETPLTLEHAEVVLTGAGETGVAIASTPEEAGRGRETVTEETP